MQSGLKKAETFHPDLMPAAVSRQFDSGSRHQGKSPITASREPLIPEGLLRMCHRFPAEDGSANGGMGSALMRLV